MMRFLLPLHTFFLTKRLIRGSVVLFSLAMGGQALRAQTGEAPRTSLGARDVFLEFHLPHVENRPKDALWRSESGTQVLTRARALGITSQSATDAWRGSETTLARAERTAKEAWARQPTLFSGSKASELNLLLASAGGASVRVTSPILWVNTPILLHRDHLRLDLGRTRLRARGLAEPYLLRIEDARDVRVRGGFFEAGGSGVLVLHGHSVMLKDLQIGGLTGGGILLKDCQDCVVWGNVLQRLGEAPLLLQGDVINTVVAENKISGNVNPSNWRAGIVMTDRNADLASDPDSLLNPDLFGVREQPMASRTHIPHDNVVAFNEITRNLSSAIYSDGAARTVIADNRIEGNSKEGICLDNGSLADVVVNNLLLANGKRWGKSDADLRLEFVLSFGRMGDGSSKAKVPAVSIDNGAYNVVLLNQIEGNYGGGLKMVRTAFYNVLGLNTLLDNNVGRSAAFHFFGIEVGSAHADTPVKDLDFEPSRGNLLFGNGIRGDHYSGIFFADHADRNQVFDNSIFGDGSWALESVKRQANFTLNNLSNLPSRNIDPGLDPALMRLSAGRFDP